MFYYFSILPKSRKNGLERGTRSAQVNTESKISKWNPKFGIWLNKTQAEMSISPDIKSNI